MALTKTLIVALGAVVAVEGVRLTSELSIEPASPPLVVQQAANSPLVFRDPNLASLRGRVAQLEERSAYVPDDVPVATEVTDQEADDEADALLAQEERRRELADWVASEAKDSEWSAGHEIAIAEAFDVEEFAGNHLVEADCRSTLCRITVTHEDDEARERFLSNLPFAAPFENVHGVLAPGDAPGNTVVYASRPDMLLPDSMSRGG